MSAHAMQAAAPVRVVRPAQGTLTRTVPAVWRGGYVCPKCEIGIALTTEGATLAGLQDAVAVHLKAGDAGVRTTDARWQGEALRATCPYPRCSTYATLDVVMSRHEGVDVAVLLARPEQPHSRTKQR